MLIVTANIFLPKPVRTTWNGIIPLKNGNPALQSAEGMGDGGGRLSV
jgi:hypothetical protein